MIEALVALAVVSAGIAAIGSLSFSSLRSGLNVERHIGLIATAQKIVTGLPDRNELADGEFAGVLDNHQWRVQASPLVNASATPAGGAGWEPQRITLHVRSPDGGVVDVDTVRLRKRPPE